MDLVIMAGGLGSRFGGLKQVESIDKNGNFIIDYTIFDAIRCGFENVIIIINRENQKIFDETIGRRVSKFIKLEYAFQDNPYPNLRTKPLGTAHAVLCAREKIKDKFVVLNADDFYGYESLLVAKQSLDNLGEKEYAMVGFKAKNTLSNFGTVKRGVCEVSKSGFLLSISESQLSVDDGKVLAKLLNKTDEQKVINEDSLVSMNLWAFDKSIFDFLEQGFNKFCLSEENIKSKEYFLPGVVEDVIKNYGFKVKVYPTSAKWFGMTYREDKQEFVKNLSELIEAKKYPENLWE